MELKNKLPEKGPVIIVGHYGSGKTEFAVNLCDAYGEKGIKPVLADLDIVNPYFRSRETRDYFLEKGIRVISSNLEDEQDFHQDLPYLAPSIRTCFLSEDQLSIIDVGGDPVGATAISQFAPVLGDKPYAMWMTVNANRPQTRTPEEVNAFRMAIEEATRMKITGYINTTHMLRETGREDVLLGDGLMRELVKETGIPAVFTVTLKEVADQMTADDLAAPLFPIKLFMRPDWL